MMEGKFRHVVELFQSARALLATDRQAEDAVTHAYSRMADFVVPAGGQLDERGVLFLSLVDYVKRMNVGEMQQLSDNSGPGDASLTALRSLPVDQAVILLLADVDGFERREISVILGVAEQEVTPQLGRARKALRLAVASEPALQDSGNRAPLLFAVSASGNG
jgi:Sigma-70, region 4